MPAGGLPDRQLQPFDQKQAVWQPGQPVMMGDALGGHGPPRGCIERLHQVLAVRFQVFIFAQDANEPLFGISQANQCIVERPRVAACAGVCRLAPIPSLCRQGYRWFAADSGPTRSSFPIALESDHAEIYSGARFDGLCGTVHRACRIAPNRDLRHDLVSRHDKSCNPNASLTMCSWIRPGIFRARPRSLKTFA